MLFLDTKCGEPLRVLLIRDLSNPLSDADADVVELILLLTPYNQLWEIFSTFLFLVDTINK